MNISQISRAVSSVLRPHYSDHDESCLLAMAHIERDKQMQRIARPMLDLFDELANGEITVVDGEPSMLMPEVDPIAGLADGMEWVPIAPALLGWIDCWKRIAPKLNLQRMQYLADRIRLDKAVTPRLVEQARAEFEGTMVRLRGMPDGEITRAITTTQIAWEFERIQERAGCRP